MKKEDCLFCRHSIKSTIFDEEHSEDEDRWITIGEIPNNKILVVIHTYRKTKGKESVRIISARKAIKNEVKQYLERRSI